MTPTHSPTTPNRARFPIATVSVLVVTAVVTGLSLVYPALLPALARRPGALADGEVWRLLTPLLVHSDGWLQIVVNLAGIAVVGVAVEGIYGAWRWLLLYLLGGVVGNLAGYAWQPSGAGASVALCGLIGGLAAWLLAGGETELPAVLFAVYLVVILAGEAVSGLVAGVVAPAVVAVVLGLALQRGATRLAYRLAALITLGAALVLVAWRDIHGPPVLVGALLGAAMIATGRRRLEPQGHST